MSGSRPTRADTTGTSKSRSCSSSRTSSRVCTRSALASSRTLAPTAAPCSASTGTCASPRTRDPYKTQAAAHFRHEAGKSAHAPGFYLHLAPGEVFAGVGIWHPDSPSLAKIRNAIASNPGKWERAAKAPDFLSEFSIGGESLKRPPKGFDPEHEYIDDLKRKDHIASVEFDEGDAVSPGFLDDFADVCRQASPYMEFLTTSLGLPY